MARSGRIRRLVRLAPWTALLLGIGCGDAGEFKQAGPVSQGALPLTFSSAVYGDSFTGVVLQDIVAIMYDFDGDGTAETSFAFRRGG